MHTHIQYTLLTLQQLLAARETRGGKTDRTSNPARTHAGGVLRGGGGPPGPLAQKSI